MKDAPWRVLVLGTADNERPYGIGADMPNQEEAEKVGFQATQSYSKVSVRRWDDRLTQFVVEAPPVRPDDPEILAVMKKARASSAP